MTKELRVILHKECGGLIGRTVTAPFEVVRAADFTPPMGPRPVPYEELRLRCMRCREVITRLWCTYTEPMNTAPAGCRQTPMERER